jgi:transposase
MLKEHHPHDLRCWIEQTKHCGIQELTSFGIGLEHDYQAVFAAFHLPWSQGITKGKVNKRQMYGRAGFSLLRHRLLLDA